MVLHDLGGDHAGIFEVSRVFEAVVLEREDVETELVALRELVIPVWPPSALGLDSDPVALCSRRLAG
jgi:hypothetical protein